MSNKCNNEIKNDSINNHSSNDSINDDGNNKDNKNGHGEVIWQTSHKCLCSNFTKY